jgi:hypothetical protein
MPTFSAKPIECKCPNMQGGRRSAGKAAHVIGPQNYPARCATAKGGLKAANRGGLLSWSGQQWIKNSQGEQGEQENNRTVIPSDRQQPCGYRRSNYDPCADE